MPLMHFRPGLQLNLVYRILLGQRLLSFYFLSHYTPLNFMTLMTLEAGRTFC
jgi:hypothetical protein